MRWGKELKRLAKLRRLTLPCMLLILSGDIEQCPGPGESILRDICQTRGSKVAHLNTKVYLLRTMVTSSGANVKKTEVIHCYSGIMLG